MGIKIGNTDISKIKIVSGYTPRLPSAYQEVEYIENTASGPRIDLGHKPTDQTMSQIKFRSLVTTGYIMYGFFAGDDNTDYRLFNYGTEIGWDIKNARIRGNTLSQNVDYERELGNHYVKDLVTSTTLISGSAVSSYTATYNMTLNHSYVDSQNSCNRWYYVKIWEGATQIRDLVPCYRIADSVVGMYDLINNVFYTNSGSGTFTKGPDVGILYIDIKKVFLGSTQVRPSLWDSLDISTATLSKQFSTGYSFQCLYVNPNENVALTAQHGTPGKIRGYTFTNEDISTAVLEGTQQPVNYIHCVFGNKTGTHIYFGDFTGNTIYEYSTTNRSVTNMVSYKSYNIGNVVQGIRVNDSETYVVVAGGNGGNHIYLYQMSTPGDISTATFIKTIDMSFNIHGIFFNNEMTKCVMCEYSASSGTVHQYDWDILNENSPTQTHTLGPVGFTIGYANITSDGTKMYAARENGYLYEYTLS